ncbi:MAG: DEAD/DEAH box helicase, partial [Acholeplasmataceae bacterium]|nr:DEAD/DEAH box helicase [Acholeplasmataceae bacterium]
KIQTAKYFVMDEADMMFDYDFLSLVDPILSSMPKAKFMLFSATIETAMEPFIKQYFGNCDFLDTTKKHELDIEYRLINIKYQDRLLALKQLIKEINPYLCFIFVSKKETQEMVYEELSAIGLSVININSSIGVKKRGKIIEDINNLKYQYVVTSDLAARGLDFKISHVIHYDLPHMLEFFQHRSGRTGRMHDSGIVITFMSVNDHRKIDKLKQKGIPFVNYQMTKEGLVKVVPKKSAFAEQDIEAIKKIKKPTKVSPNYKKKNKAKIKKAKQEVRREAYAKNR